MGLTDTGAAGVLAIMVFAFVLGLSGALMPGPVLTVTIAHAAKRGVVAGLLVGAGHAVVELALLFLLLIGAVTFFDQPFVTGTVALIGAIVLGFMAWGMFKEARVTTGLPQPGVAPGSVIGPIAGGALASISNPYWFVWWATVGTGYLVYALGSHGYTGAGAFFTGHILADIAFLTFAAAVITGGRRFFTLKVYKGMLNVLAAFLVIMSLAFIYYGITTLV